MATMIGIDPHKATHTAVAVDGNENVLGEVTIVSSSDQADVLRRWAARFDDPSWAVESAQGLGYLVARQLTAAGEVVFDVPPVLASRVRLMGTGRTQKNDSNDARSVAVAALRSDRLLRVRGDERARVLRLLVKRHQDMTEERTRQINRLHGLLAELKPGGIGTEFTVSKASAVLAEIMGEDDITQCRHMIAGELLSDICQLNDAVAASKKRLSDAVVASGTTLTKIHGIGPFTAAIIIGVVDDITRFGSKAQFASYNGTAPIEASSGPNRRHRLNPKGNRAINHALHIAAVSQLSHPTEGRAYYDRKRAEGKSSKEAIRALKRRISDRVYQHLVADAR